MSIIVTGGAGFIGSNFVRVWLDKNVQDTVIVLDKLTYAGSLKNLEGVDSDRMIFIQGDINDRLLVEELFNRYRPKSLANFAAESHVDRSINDPEEFIYTNVNGTFNLLRCAYSYFKSLEEERKKFRFLQISTDEVYGSLEEGGNAFTEEHSYRPNNPYAASKASADHLVRAYGHTFGLPVLVTNCSNNFGPYQHQEKLIPTIILNALNESPIPIYGDGQNIRDWIYVTDHCLAIMAVLNKGKVGESYNLGANMEKTNLDIAKIICSKLDQIFPRSNQRSYHELIAFVEDRPGHDRRYAINNEKFLRELNFNFNETFISAIEKTISFYLRR
ncbi:dTDP-glucose 4,6-dehydratase [Bacteriovorax stolpii]|uniref:dTDP-glucose 4,6-dehydratase n=1 Tax=Bacteriovorax stolpii TaxID=960 RepID=UPI0011577B11|nr:dTDP-glucose 4,6-dehydratase [Bacteriovorax stolpii]QDK43257.1 dTDP-glucose 4,6-dehydratase [Bacteriovorax stolpii]